MTSYQNTIMDLLQGDTPKAKHDYLVSLILKDISERDKFAMEFAEWIAKNYKYFDIEGKYISNDHNKEWSSAFNTGKHLVWLSQEQLLELFKQAQGT